MTRLLPRLWHSRDRIVNHQPFASLVTLLDPYSEASEAYRTLGITLMHAPIGASRRVVVITSPSPLEGKSTTCANLGVVLAQAEKRTLIADCDFRKPAMHKIFELRNTIGMADVLAGERSLQEACQQTSQQRLQVMTAGLVPPNPVEPLSSERFSQLLDKMRQEFDYIVVDVPPTSLVTDPLIVAAQGDVVLLVVDARVTREIAVKQSLRSLENVGAHVLGTVVNNAKTFNMDSYYPERLYSQ